MMLLTFALIVFGWIIFRANNITEFVDYLYCIVNNFCVAETEGIPKKIAIIYCNIIVCGVAEPYKAVWSPIFSS